MLQTEAKDTVPIKFVWLSAHISYFSSLYIEFVVSFASARFASDRRFFFTKSWPNRLNLTAQIDGGPSR